MNRALIVFARAVMSFLLVLAPVALPLINGCAATTNPVTAVNVGATDAGLIATGLASAVATLQATPNPTAAQQATLTQLQGYLATVQADAKQIAASTATPATSVISEIVQIVQTIAPIALSFVPGGGAIVPIINAAVSLAPQLLADLGLSAATLNGQPLPTPKYTPDQARAILRGA